MATSNDSCPLCGLPADSSVAHVWGGGVRAGVRSFRCARCKGFIVHDNAQQLLAGLDYGRRKELSREARRRENANELRLEITRAMMVALGLEAMAVCPHCGHAGADHDVNVKDPLTSVGPVGMKGIAAVGRHCRVPGCSCGGSP